MSVEHDTEGYFVMCISMKTKNREKKEKEEKPKIYCFFCPVMREARAYNAIIAITTEIHGDQLKNRGTSSETY